MSISHKLLWLLLANCARVELYPPENNEKVVLTAENALSAKVKRESLSLSPKSTVWARKFSATEANSDELALHRRPRGLLTRAVHGPSMARPAIVALTAAMPAEAVSWPSTARSCVLPPFARWLPSVAASGQTPAPRALARYSRNAAGIGSGTARAAGSAGVPADRQLSRARRPTCCGGREAHHAGRAFSPPPAHCRGG